MTKKSIKTILKNSNEILENNLSAICSLDAIKFVEDNVKVIIEYKDERLTMKRFNDEYELELNFKKNVQTKGTYFLKQEHLSFDIELYTTILEYNQSFLKLNYKLADECYEYIIEVNEEVRKW